MARITTKNVHAAFRKHFQKRFFGLSLGHEYADADFDNNDSLTWSNAADTASVYGMKVDTDDMLNVGDAAVQPLRQAISKFYLGTAGALVTQTVFIADRPCVITDIGEVHGTAETATGTATLSITHETGTQAPGTGATTMAATIDLKGTANTVQWASLLSPKPSGAPNAGIVLATGDRLSIKVGGTATITALAGVAITIYGRPGAKANTGAYYMPTAAGTATQTIFIANRDCEISAINAIVSAPETATGTYTLDVTKDTSTNAPGAGTTCLAATVNLKSITANTVSTPALTATTATLRLAAGNRIAVKFAGSATPTAIAGVCVIVSVRNVGSSNYINENKLTCSLLGNGLQATTPFFIADRDYLIADWSEVHSTAGSDTTPPTVDLVICKGTTAAASGTSVSGSALSVHATANTVQVGAVSSRRLGWIARGDRLALKFSGTLTALVGTAVTVSLEPR